ncbi:hypothetical protein EUZ93_00085 [Wolbachia pipientis]|nr:hypothetical protein [Wolbachia pipientis]
MSLTLKPQPSWFAVPYVPTVSEKFNRINSGKIRIAYFSITKLRKFIKLHKDPLPHDMKSNILYKICCKECDASYVGQTERQLKSRITEHRSYIRWNTTTRSVIPPVRRGS